MKTALILSAAVMLSMGSAFAHGVEKIVPSDAHHFQLAGANLSQVETGEIPATDPWGCSEDGTPCASTPLYTTELHVQLTYQSNDNTDVPQGTDGDSFDNAKPTVDAYFDLTSDQVAAIKAKKLDPKAVVSWTVAPQQAQVEDPSWQYQCNYDSESNQKIDDGCVEPTPPMVTVTQLVLSISVN
jgi:hypothetical protein